jgi:hypothetical protein
MRLNAKGIVKRIEIPFCFLQYSTVSNSSIFMKYFSLSTSIIFNTRKGTTFIEVNILRNHVLGFRVYDGSTYVLSIRFCVHFYL